MAIQIVNQLVSPSIQASKTFKGTNPGDTITVHMTGNTSAGANAKSHANLQSNNWERQTSWHISVDDRAAYRSFPNTARCFHAGDGSGRGNMASVAVEVCVNSDGNYTKSVQNAADVVAQLMKELGHTNTNVIKQHNYWSGKNCPTQLRAGKDGITWSNFIAMVKKNMSGSTSTPDPAPAPSKSVSELAAEVIAGKHGNGDARKAALGSQYAAVQAEVNRVLAAGESASSSSPNKSVSQLALEVIAGKHGNGEDRKDALGSQYAAVQAEVNKILYGASSTTPAAPAAKTVAQLAADVIAGKHGTGVARKKSLGSQYVAVQAEVNRQLAASNSSKTISQLADEVIAGKHGNGAARKKSLGSKYAAVQKEVNRRLG